MRYLRWNGHPTIDLFADHDFIDFIKSLDAEMKRLQYTKVLDKKMPGRTSIPARGRDAMAERIQKQARGN